MKLKNCCFFFFEVYFEAPKMYTNQLSNICNEAARELNICSFTKYFSVFSSQICSAVICKEIFEILRTSVSHKTFQQWLLIFLRFSKYTFPEELQYIGQDRRLRCKKALDAQNLEWKSNCTEMAKYTRDFKHKIYCNVQQNLTKQFALHSAEAFRSLSNV